MALAGKQRQLQQAEPAQQQAAVAQVARHIFIIITMVYQSKLGQTNLLGGEENPVVAPLQELGDRICDGACFCNFDSLVTQLSDSG